MTTWDPLTHFKMMGCLSALRASSAARIFEKELELKIAHLKLSVDYGAHDFEFSSWGLWPATTKDHPPSALCPCTEAAHSFSRCPKRSRRKSQGVPHLLHRLGEGKKKRCLKSHRLCWGQQHRCDPKDEVWEAAVSPKANCAGGSRGNSAKLGQRRTGAPQCS